MSHYSPSLELLWSTHSQNPALYFSKKINFALLILKPVQLTVKMEHVINTAVVVLPVISVTMALIVVKVSL